MTLKIPVVFDPTSRLVVEDLTGANHPFEAIAANNLLEGSLVYVYNVGGEATVDIADAGNNLPSTGFVLDTVMQYDRVAVYTSGMNKALPLSQGDGAGGEYIFTSSDIGLPVYLDNTMVGKITKEVPTSPNYQRVGEVIGVTDTYVEIVFRPSISAAQDTLTYKGTWDADTNTPTLSAPPPGGSVGWYYIVSVSGTTDIGGIATWSAGDWILSDGSAWSRVQNTTQLQLTTTVTPTAIGLTGAIGDSTEASPANHTHAIPDTILQTLLTASVVPLAAGATGAIGNSVFAAHANHVHPKNVVKTPIRFYFESPVATTDKQPAMRIDGPSNLTAIHYYSTTPGTGTILIKVDGTTVATIGLSGTDNGFEPQAGFTPVALSADNIITATVSSPGAAAGVTVQLEIEQSA